MIERICKTCRFFEDSNRKPFRFKCLLLPRKNGKVIGPESPDSKCIVSGGAWKRKTKPSREDCWAHMSFQISVVTANVKKTRRKKL